MSRRTIRLTLCCIAIFTACCNRGDAIAQVTAPSSDTANFEAASIKPTPVAAKYPTLLFTSDGFTAKSATLRMILRQAFGVFDSSRYAGGPAWIDEKIFDIQAKFDPTRYGAMKIEERRAMLLRLLEERFHLVAHHEMRNYPLYALVVGQAGPKFEKSQPDDIANYPTLGTVCHSGNKQVEGEMDFHGCTMDEVAQTLTFIASTELNRTVVNQTGFQGRYSFVLRWTPETNAPETGADTGAPWIREALDKELGLELRSTSGPLDTIVIDHIEMPTAN